jgi:diadenosine tetraphosphate (Ap4A) HIT family hydrolase
VVNVNDEDHPAFCRVILQRHAREMTDLNESERADLMHIVFAVEQAQRKLLEPEKINHWHVIPRFRLDPHYPNPVWGSRTAGTSQALPDGYWGRFHEELVNRLD